MGSGSSRPGSRPSRRLRSDRPKRSLSSLLICGACTSHAPNEMEDNPYEVLANSVKRDPVVDKLQSPTKEFALDSGAGTGLTSQWTDTGTLSESSTEDSEGSSFLGSLINAGTSNQGECSSRTEDLVPPDRLDADYRGNDSASSSNEGRLSSDPFSADIRSNMGVVNGVGNRMGKDVSVICADIIHPISLSPQQPGASQPDELSVENYARELLAIQNSDTGSASVVCNYPVTSDLLRDDSLQESLPPGLGFLVSDRELGRGVGSVLQVDVVSISSSISSSNSSEISSREARRNGRRLFWDAFSRHSSRRDGDSPAFVFSNDDTDGLGSHDRWLLDFSSDFADDGVGGDSGFLGNRIRSMNEQTLPSRSEGQERLHGGHVRDNSQRSICRSGLHPTGTCSCESILMAEESGSRASISRIVMLAEALFEVLDEIHRQPVSLSLAVVSLPAPEAVVDSFPVRNHRKPLGTESGDDTAQCYICLSEYEEGDEIRVLPCRHEFHTSCVDKWLKEIHGVCPLCRGDVREGLMEESASNSETPSV